MHFKLLAINFFKWTSCIANNMKMFTGKVYSKYKICFWHPDKISYKTEEELIPLQAGDQNCNLLLRGK